MFALAADVLLGEPPMALHPTAWMGRAIDGVRRRSRGASPGAAFAGGWALSLAGIVATAVAARASARTLERLPRRVRPIAEGVALKPALSLRALLAAGETVERALADGRLGAARRRLAFHLVSRPTGDLAPHEVAGAAISSLAENLSDALVAPLMAYCVGGLPAAYAYRFINTADAMLGYRTPELEWLGKPSARIDDAVNLVPARVTAGLIAIAAPLVGGSARRTMRVAFSDASRTASPNAGWPMAAMAGALDVTLDKRGSYALNESGRRATANDIARARRVIAVAAVVAALLTEAVCVDRA
jgi:adenosylcobinamide-phosphate synthase